MSKKISNKEREFTPILTWCSFLRNWEEVKTEPAAIGLLHIGSGINQYQQENPPDEVFCLYAQVPFYLDVAERADEMGTVAQQQIVTGLLRKASALAWDNPLAIDAHKRLVKFLGFRHETLVKPPYPRFISEFLWQAFHKWRGAHARVVHEAYKSLRTEDWPLGPLANALLTWGAADALTFQEICADRKQREEDISEDAQAQEIFPIIDAFLKERYASVPTSIANCAAGALLKDHAKPITNLYDESQRAEAWRRACLVWIWCAGRLMAAGNMSVPELTQPTTADFVI
jgi:hypothetical protein